MTKNRRSSSSLSSGHYLKRRTQELASPATRAKTDPLARWAVRRMRLDGRPFRFEGHEYLRTLFDDVCPHIVMSKAAQVGGTVYGIFRSLHACLNGLNVIYFFPTRTDVLEFSKSRVGPLLADNAFLAKMMRDTDTAGLKRIGDAHLYFRGMQSTVGMKSVPADMVVFDELDEVTPEARSLAMERVAHSDYKRVIELSNPSLPGYGIDEQYEKSDQRHWTLKCSCCGAWTALDREFPTRRNEEVKIIRPHPDGTWYRACVHCGAELDLAAGEWVADYPDRKIHGYRISQLFSSKVDPGEILHEYRTSRFLDRFYNLKIGVPYADLERRVDVPTVLSLCEASSRMPEQRRIHAMGVDTGKDLHVVILARDWYDQLPMELIHLEACQNFEELDRLMRRFQVERCVIDGLPETHSTRAFAERNDDVYLSFFSETQAGSAHWDPKDHKVIVNRTEALDASRALLREKKLILPAVTPQIEEFARHIAADAKILDEDEKTGARRYRYVKSGTNHYSFALTYALMAARGMSLPMTPETWAYMQRLTAF